MTGMTGGMIVEWKPWPVILVRALNLVGIKSAQGTLRIQSPEPGALGRLALKDANGRLICYLIDGRTRKEKAFHLPFPLTDDGFCLVNEAGETVFSANRAPENGAPAGTKNDENGHEITEETTDVRKETESNESDEETDRNPAGGDDPDSGDRGGDPGAG